MDYRTLHTKTVSDLRLLAKQNGVKLPVGANKMRIVELILESEKMNAEQALAKNTVSANAEGKNEEKASQPEKDGAPEEAADEKQPEHASAPAKRGRPRKIKPGAEAQAPKKRGRPKKDRPAEDDKAGNDGKKAEDTASIASAAKKIPDAPAEPAADISHAQSAENQAQTREREDGEEKSSVASGSAAEGNAVSAAASERPQGRTEAPYAHHRSPSFTPPVRMPYRQYAEGSAQTQTRQTPLPARGGNARSDPSPRQQEAQAERAYRRNTAPEGAQNAGESTPRRELYGESGIGTANAAVAEMLQNNECQEGAGVLEMHPEGYGFLRAENYLPGTNDVYVSIAQIRRFNLRNGDYIVGKTRPQREGDRYTGLVFINTVNGETPDHAQRRPRFEDLTPVYPDSRLFFETGDGKNDLALRAIDLIAPVGKGQRGMIVSPPKAGKTVLLKKIANAITDNYPDMHLIVLLIDERPEEVTDLKRSIRGEVVYSTFDETPENHTRLSEMTLDRAQRLVEMGKDVVILMDSITRLARAYNLVIPPTGRSLSGGLDPGALHKPKRFFGAARNIENGGSLTIIATALVETGSRMDDIIYEEFKGTGNMELHLDRKLSERRIFPAIDLAKSGTRREELLLTQEEAECSLSIRRMLSSAANQDTFEQLIGLMAKTPNNREFITRMRGWVRVWQKEGYMLDS